MHYNRMACQEFHKEMTRMSFGIRTVNKDQAIFTIYKMKVSPYYILPMCMDLTKLLPYFLSFSCFLSTVDFHTCLCHIGNVIQIHIFEKVALFEV